MTGRVVLDAPAKFNPWLHVLEARDDGYHELRTLFCALELADHLDVRGVDRPGVRLRVRGADVGPIEANLVHRAASAFLESTAAPGGCDIVLVKRIPAGAGLGGGSSDAAATLLALDALTGGLLGPRRRAALGVALGSDVGFFLRRAPLALARGRGERVRPIAPLPARPALVATPPFAVATGDAYARLDAARAGAGAAPPARAEAAPPARGELALNAHGWAAIAARAGNDFERVVFAMHPALRAAHEALRRAGADLVRLAGSGSSLVALFGDTASRDAAAARLRGDCGDFTVRPTRTLARWPEPRRR